MKNVGIGELNERITFYQVANEKDDWGEVVKTEKEVMTCWALVRSQFYKEIISTIGTTLQNSTTFIIRHQQKVKITSDMTISYRNQKYEIIQITPDIYDKKFDLIIAKVVS